MSFTNKIPVFIFLFVINIHNNIIFFTLTLQDISISDNSSVAYNTNIIRVYIGPCTVLKLKIIEVWFSLFLKSTSECCTYGSVFSQFDALVLFFMCSCRNAGICFIFYSFAKLRFRDIYVTMFLSQILTNAEMALQQ